MDFPYLITRYISKYVISFESTVVCIKEPPFRSVILYLASALKKGWPPAASLRPIKGFCSASYQRLDNTIRLTIRISDYLGLPIATANFRNGMTLTVHTGEH